MKTVYFTTDRCIRRKDNVIDLCEYRERMERSMAAEGQVAVNGVVGPRWVHDAPEWCCEVTPTRADRPRPAPSGPRNTGYRLADLLEIAASAGALVLVATVWLQFLL